MADVCKGRAPRVEKEEPSYLFHGDPLGLDLLPSVQSLAQRQLQQLSIPTCAKINK